MLPLAATAAEMKPVVRPADEQVRSNDALDNVRRRMNASSPPAWRTDVDEHRESPAPRFSNYAVDEEPRKGFPFKAIAVAMVLVSFALFGYSWYRGRKTAAPPADQAAAPVAVPQQQPAVEAPTSDTQAPAAVSPGSQSDNSSIDTKDNSAEETTPPERPLTVKAKPSRTAPLAQHVAAVAPDTTTEIGLPPAPLVVEGGKRHATRTAPSTDTQVAPPSLDAVAGAAKPGLGPVMNSAPVDLPKLAAVPPKRVKVSQGVTQGLLVRQVRPQYPSMARESRVEGDVLLEAVISKDGSVSDVRAISGPALLIPPALQAVRQWRYKPYLLNGEPVEVETQIKVQFRL